MLVGANGFCSLSRSRLPRGCSAISPIGPGARSSADSTHATVDGRMLSGEKRVNHSIMIAMACLLALAPAASAHPGGLAADGCHNDRKNGGRHCHRSPSGSAQPAERPQRLLGGETYFPNCSAARAAGAAPVRRGSPGYGRHLDRDGDGVGCE